MLVLAWIGFGVFAGFIANRLVGNHGAGTPLDIALGIVGAVVGGLVFNAVGAVDFTRFNVWSLFVAVLGAMSLLFVYHTTLERRVRLIVKKGK